MQRRSRQAVSDLPMTASDVGRSPLLKTPSDRNKVWNHSTTNRRNKQNKNKSPSTLLTCGLFLLVITLIGCLVTFDFNFVSHHPQTEENVGSKRMAQETSPLSQFNSLQYALTNADLVGIYFAASWCSMSTPVSQTLERLFSNKGSMDNRVLQPIRNTFGDVKDDFEHKDLAIVYISSDESENEMMDYSRWNWINVPYDGPDRSNIKRHFRTCAEREMGDLGIEMRRSEIPALIIIDSVTQGVLTSSGVADMDEYGEEVLDHWLQLQQLQRAMEDKYENM